MQKSFKKFMGIILAVVICLAALTMSVGADAYQGEDNVTASSLANYINSICCEQEWNSKGENVVEFDSATKTVKVVCDIEDTAEIWLNNLSEDIIFDLSGHTIHCYSFVLDDDDYNNFTFKDTVGGGKMVGFAGPEATVGVFGKVNVIFESGMYVGGYASETMNPNTEPETVWWIDTASPALRVSGEDAKIDIRGGTFIGGNGLDRTDVDQTFIENAAPAIEIYSAAEFRIFGNTVVKGGDGDNSNGGHGIALAGDCESEEIIYNIEIQDAQIIGGNGVIGGDAINSLKSEAEAEEYSVVNGKIVDTYLKGGVEGGKEINISKESELEIINTPTAVDVSVEGVNAHASEGVFAKNTVIDITALTSGDSFDKANAVLDEISNNYLIYDICAKIGDYTVQPEGKVTVNFKIPEDFDVNKTGIYYITEDSQAHRLETMINAEQRIASAELEHLSIYAVVDERTAEDIASENEVSSESSETSTSTQTPESSVMPESAETLETVVDENESQGDIVSEETVKSPTTNDAVFCFAAVILLISAFILGKCSLNKKTN